VAAGLIRLKQLGNYYRGIDICRQKFIIIIDMVKANKQKEEKEKKKESELNEALEEIKQRFGEGAIMKLSGVRAVDVDVIPTGSISLDVALGVGGVPRGRIIEIYGPESTGKTTLALSILAEAQKKGGAGAFIDAEHALDPV